MIGLIDTVRAECNMLGKYETVIEKDFQWKIILNERQPSSEENIRGIPINLASEQ